MGASILALIINFSIVPLTAGSVNYVKPQNDDNDVCPGDHPCLTLGNYTQQKDAYFVSNTEFIFLPGNHQVDNQLSFENLTNVTIQGDNDLNNRSIIVFTPLTYINWTDCTNITIIHL